MKPTCKDKKMVYKPELKRKVCEYANKVGGQTALCEFPYKITFFCYHTEVVRGTFSGDAEVVSLNDCK